MPGQPQEHVVEARPAQSDVLDPYPRQGQEGQTPAPRPGGRTGPRPPGCRQVGPEIRAQVRLLDQGSEEDRHAARLLRRKYPLVQGALVPLAHRLMRTSTLHYEVRSASTDGAGPDVT
ncbi:hypothetical protein WJ438_22810 [Streptomyces sp. GD-15H]